MHNIYIEDHPGTIYCMRDLNMWHSLHDLLEVIKNMEAIDFETPNCLEKMDDLLSELITPESLKKSYNLFDFKRRFPPLDAYVFVYAPEYAESFSQIISTVKKAMLVYKDGYDQEQLTSLVDDYYKSLANLKANLGRGDHVYDQSKFEEKLGLHWQ